MTEMNLAFKASKNSSALIWLGEYELSFALTRMPKKDEIYFILKYLVS